MAVQMSRRRVREIAVRKTLGATTGQAVVLLIRDFSKPVLFGCLAAWPLGYVAAEAYLDVFIRRVPVSALPFLGSLLLSLGLAWLVVGGQALRAARVRPGEVLRTE